MKKSLFMILFWAGAALICRADMLESIDAVVNNELILSGEVDEALRIVFKDQAATIPKDQYDHERRRLLIRMIDDLLIMSEVRQRILPEQQAMISQRVEELTNQDMAQYRAQFTTPQDLAREERRLGMSWEELRRAQFQRNERAYIRESVVPQLIRRKINPPTPEELQRFQSDNPTLKPGETLQIAHILLRVPPNVTPEAERAIQQKAMEITMRARANEPFDQLAKVYSEHEETKNTGGLLPPFRKGEFIPEFDSLFDLNEGDVSDPIRSRQGYHAVKIIKKPSWQNYYLEQQRNQIIVDWISELRSKAKVDIRQDPELQDEWNKMQSTLK